MPLFSIIIPVYRPIEEYFKNCINSLLNQTYANIEIIIIGDGCEEDVIKLSKRLELIDQRVRFYYQENSGVSVARNLGISKAKGEWVLFLDADDWFQNNACEILRNLIINDLQNKDHIEIIQFASRQVFENYSKNFIYNLVLGEYCDYDSKFILLRRCIQPTSFFKHPNQGATISHIWDKCFKREFLINNNICFQKGLPLSEDKLFFIDCLFKVKGILVIDNILHNYRESASSVKHSFSKTLDKDRLFIFELIDKKLKENKFMNDNDTILMNDFYGFIISSTSEVIVRKFYHKDYSKKFDKQNCEDLNNFVNSPYVVNAFNNIDNRDLKSKANILVFLLKNKLFTIVNFIINIIDKNKNRQK